MNKKIKILLKIDGTRELKISWYMQLGEKVYYSLSSVNLSQVNRFLSLKKKIASVINFNWKYV